VTVPGPEAVVDPRGPADPARPIGTPAQSTPRDPGAVTSAAGPGQAMVVPATPAPQADLHAGSGSVAPGSRLTGEAPGQQPPPRPGPLRRVLSYLNRDDRPLVRDALLAVVVLIAGFCATFWLEDRISSQQQALDDSRAERQEVLENTRFIREVVINPDARVQPFQRLNLVGASLAGLDLDCRTREDIKEVQVVAGGGDSCANLSYANLTGADLYSANLFGADLSGADLTDASLGSAYLLNASLSYADLTGADLSYADIFGSSKLVEANLTGADLRGADLMGADLTGANLTDANLTGADLSSLDGANPTPDNPDANLTGATLTDICHDQETKWPAGFSPPPPNCSEW
jgi:uncharacterized protein YjbI with pentapeptide repeats